MVLWIMIFVLLAFALFLATRKKDKVTVYGSMNCGWTVKQLNNLQGRAEFFDCNKYKCPDFVKGFPTCVKNGQVYTGFQENI